MLMEISESIVRVMSLVGVAGILCTAEESLLLMEECMDKLSQYIYRSYRPTGFCVQINRLCVGMD